MAIILTQHCLYCAVAGILISPDFKISDTGCIESEPQISHAVVQGCRTSMICESCPKQCSRNGVARTFLAF